jgi:hypothetical protein
MASALTEFREAIDAFLVAPKTPQGADQEIEWQPGREFGERRVKLPLEIAGELRGSLLVLAYPRHPTLKFSIGLIFPPAVCRLDFGSDLKHGNNVIVLGADVPPIVRGPHYHPWSLNREFANSTITYFKLPVAVPVSIRQFDACLRWFCSENNILLPGQHSIALPPKDQLI